MEKQKVKKADEGFTLIELLVSMAIIAVLVSIVIVAILAARLQQRNHQRRTFASNIKTALEAFYANQRQYPGTTGATVSAYGTNNLSNALASGTNSYWSGLWPGVGGSPADPLTQNNRVVYCSGGGQFGTGRYMLLIFPETGITGQNDPALPACSQVNTSTPPAGWDTFSN